MSEENKIKALLVKVHEPPVEVDVGNDWRSFSSHVGGYIEFYPLENNVSIVLNEEGKLIGLPGNRCVGNEIIAGDFLIVGDNDIGECISLTPNQIAKYKERFKTPEEYTKEQVEDNIHIEVITFSESSLFTDPRPTVNVQPHNPNSKDKSPKEHYR